MRQTSSLPMSYRPGAKVIERFKTNKMVGIV
jgi:hypothetical protein